MAKKKKQGEGATPKSSARTGQAVSFYLDDDVAEALRQYIDSTMPRVSKTATYEAALCEFLRARGFWPLQNQPKEGGCG